MKCDVVFATDFNSPSALIRFLIHEEYKQVLFNWRGLLKEGSKTYFFRKEYSKLITQASVHVLIPDYLGLNPRFISEEELLLKSIHGYWVTCRDLETKYHEQFPYKIPNGVLHDLPDVEKIRELRGISHRSEGIIWVGNSKWGERYGYKDLKGYQDIITPLKQKIGSNLPNLKFRVFDSALKRVDNELILREIAGSRVLVQASASEGTGLPILEALGLGVIPVTTHVGVAPELLINDFAQFIVHRNPIAFYSGVTTALSVKGDFSQSCTKIFDDYIDEIEAEKIHWVRSETQLNWKKPKLLESIRIRVVWLVRMRRARGGAH
jgi:glycosyltransferase involved in cell wall biosynthesis